MFWGKTQFVEGKVKFKIYVFYVKQLEENSLWVKHLNTSLSIQLRMKTNTYLSNLFIKFHFTFSSILNSKFTKQKIIQLKFQTNVSSSNYCKLHKKAADR